MVALAGGAVSHERGTHVVPAETLPPLRAGPSRSSATIRKEAGFFCGSFLRRGEVLAFVRRDQNLKDLEDLWMLIHGFEHA